MSGVNEFRSPADTLELRKLALNDEICIYAGNNSTPNVFIVVDAKGTLLCNLFRPQITVPEMVQILGCVELDTTDPNDVYYSRISQNVIKYNSIVVFLPCMNMPVISDDFSLQMIDCVGASVERAGQTILEFGCAVDFVEKIQEEDKSELSIGQTNYPSTLRELFGNAVELKSCINKIISDTYVDTYYFLGLTMQGLIERTAIEPSELASVLSILESFDLELKPPSNRERLKPGVPKTIKTLLGDYYDKKRILKVFSRNKIYSTNQLLEYSKKQLLQMTGIGSKTVALLENNLKNFDLKLASS